MELLISLLVFSILALSAHGDPIFPNNSSNQLSAEPCDSANSQCPSWITLKVDHFDGTNTGTWQMRYFAYEGKYEPGGPLFIVVGGEHPVNGYNEHSLMYEMAQEMRGYLFYTEHRYYGESRPTSDMSIDNLKYLSIDQAIADLINFIDYQRKTLPGAQSSRVILSGCSYSAMLATWLHQQHPGIVSGVWAASAPLGAKMDFWQYKVEVSNNILKVGGGDCSKRIRTAFAKMEEKFASGEVADMKRLFGLCQYMDAKNKLDVQYFLFMVSNVISQVVQNYSPGDIEGACKVLNDPAIDDPVEAVGVLFQQKFGGSSCIDITSARFINLYSNTQWAAIKPSPLGYSRPFIYQLCNELGWFPSSTSKEQMFGSSFPIQLHVELCQALFGSRFTYDFMQQKIDETNEKHKGFWTQVKNVFFTYGQFDPWLSLVVQNDYNEDSPLVIIKGRGQCSDQKAISDSDSPYLKEIKERITARVRFWNTI